MSAQKLAHDLDAAFQHQILEVSDPGSGGTISPEYQGLSICRVTTAGAETRVAASAAKYGVGQRLLVILEVAGGNLTVDTDDTDVILTTAGQFAEFVVVKTSASAKAWRMVASSTRTAGVNLPASAGTYEFLVDDTGEPQANDAIAGILAIVAALDTAGLIDGSGITQATS